jgi:hypothetical protein
MKPKFYLTLIAFLLFGINSKSQTMEASIGVGSGPKRVIVYIKPSSPLTNGIISTIQFDVAINAAVTPVPTISIVGTPAFGINWYPDPSFVEDGYRHYQFVNIGFASMTINPAIETPLIELEFIGGPATISDVSLVTLPLGGSTGNSLFLCTGAATSVEGQLYYVRPGTTVVNNDSYTGTLPSTATINSGILPVTWLSFNAVKQANDAVLNWAVTNESSNARYELQRSTNGTNFTAIGTINKSLAGNYNYTDAGINTLGASILYYRIKQIDNSGKISYSDVRNLRLEIKGNQIGVFPNPAKEGFYVSIPFINADNRKVKLTLVAPDGSIVSKKEITAAMASNYYFDIKDKKLAAGLYNLQIVFEEKVLEIKKLQITQ